MSQTQTDAHPTHVPEQAQTDTYMVFDAIPIRPNMALIGRVDVPRYSRPDQHGVELDRDKRLSLAVHRAVDQAPACVGHTFLVLDELDGDYERVEYTENPAFDVTVASSTDGSTDSTAPMSQIENDAIWDPDQDGDAQ